MFFGKKTVAQVVSAFTKTIDELETVEREQTAEAKRQLEIEAQAQAAREAAARESKLARQTIEAFRKIIPSAVVGESA